MTTRLGDAAQAARITELMLGSRARIQATQSQIASGRSAERYDAISRDAALLLRSQDLRVRIERHVSDADRVMDRLRVMEGALGNLAGLAEQLRASLLSRLNEATGKDMPLATQAREMLEEALGRMNVRLDDRYLFAGTRTDTAPVALADGPITEPDPALYYQGDGHALSARLDGDSTVRYGITAERAAFAHLLAALGNAILGHENGDRGQLEAALDQASTAIEAIAADRGQLGATLKRVETVGDGHKDMLLYLDGAIGRVIDADVPLLLARLAKDQLMLEASFMVTGQLSRLSLVDHLR